jgi:hypothetical protein
MRILISIVLILSFKVVFGQIDFEPDTNRNTLFPGITSKIKDIPNDFDFQLRFWEYGGLSLPDKKSLFIMTMNNGNWDCQSYRFISNKRKGYSIHEAKTKIDNCDSTWDYFMKNDILNLPDMQALKKDFHFVDQNGDTLVMLIDDGLLYTLEFIKPGKYKRIEYDCPVTYGKKYTHIPELQYMTNIIRLIYRKIGNSYEPW